MVPQPTITPPAALLPRQTDDTYGLSSLYAQLSSLYPELYSSAYNADSAYSSLLADYSAIYASVLASYSDNGYSIPNYYPTFAAVSSATARPRLSSGFANGARPTSTLRSSSTGSASSSGGLSSSAKTRLGLTIGIPLALALLLGVGIFLWCAGKRKGKKSSTTIVVPPIQQQPQQQQPQQQQPQQPQQQQAHPYQAQPYQAQPYQAQPYQVQHSNYVNNQGYMQGFQPTAPPPHNLQPQAKIPYASGYKEPVPGVVELEHEYHFARPGVVEMGDNSESVAQEQPGKKLRKGKK
jgi:hypothetical protein